MTVFERSVEGQRNRNLFLQSDLIVYVEGGDETQGLHESFDVLFWSRVFKAFRPNLRIRVLPKGGKTDLLAIASTFLGSAVDGVCVAMDADYDRLNNVLIEDSRVLYTFGYSYENDAFCAAALKEAFYVLCPRCPQDLDISDEIHFSLARLDAATKSIVRADFLAVGAGLSVINRDRPRKYIVGAYGNRPQINKELMISDLRKMNNKERPRPLRRNVSIETRRYLVGHVYAEFSYVLLAFLHSAFSKRAKITKDGFFSTTIQSFYETLKSDSESAIALHYSHQVHAVPVGNGLAT